MLSVSAIVLTFAIPALPRVTAAQAGDSHVVSDYVLVQVRPDVEPATLPDGQFTFSYSANAEAPPNGLAVLEGSMARSLTDWSVHAIDPVIAPAQIDDLARAHGLDRFYAVRVPRGTDTAAMVAELDRFTTHLQDVSVASYGVFLAEPQGAPNDPFFFPDQWAMYNDGETPLTVPCPGNCQDPASEFTPGVFDADIDGLEAWNLETGHPLVMVGVLDTGADRFHPDLVDRWMRLDGSNFSGPDADAPWTTVSSHGTWVAGVIAANRNNGLVTAGISPGSMIVPVRMGNFTFSTAEAMQAINFARLQPRVLIINMSWKINESLGLQVALLLANSADKLLVAAAGNSTNGDQPVTYPASHPHVMAVSGTDRFDELFFRSNTGPEVDVAAPGDAIVTTSILGALNPNGCVEQNYCRRDGTSMAAAHVSGVAALTWSVAPLYFDSEDIREIIESTADDLGPAGVDDSFGHGRVNAYAAVCEAQRRVRDDLFGCPGDVNLDGMVDLDDVFVLLGSWGEAAVGDLDCDQEIGDADLEIVYDNWGPCPEAP